MFWDEIVDRKINSLHILITLYNISIKYKIQIKQISELLSVNRIPISNVI